MARVKYRRRRVPRVRYSDPVPSMAIRAHKVGVPNPWHPEPRPPVPSVEPLPPGRSGVNPRAMPHLSTGPISHDQLYDEAVHIQETLQVAGVRAISVCCAFGVDVDHPIFARSIPIEVAGLSDFLRRHEDAGAFRLGLTNITLTYEYEGLKFFFGNDEDVFCEGEESPMLRGVRQRWASRYPFPWLPIEPDPPEPE